MRTEPDPNGLFAFEISSALMASRRDFDVVGIVILPAAPSPMIVHWTITGRAWISNTYKSKEEFVGDDLASFGPRFLEPFRTVKVRGVHEDADTMIFLWDGEGTRLAGKPCENTYTWFVTFQDGPVAEATAFYDNTAFNELWDEVGPYGA